MDEFSFIEECLAPLAGPEGLSLLDDAAVMSPRPGYDLVLTKDTMVEGVHFPNGFYGAETAGKLLRVNLSDLAAKGAKPKGYLLSIAWPREWESAEFQLNSGLFASGLEAVQSEFGFDLYGGDTVKTDGSMVISATLIGEVQAGTMVKRSGAKPGDDVWVSGTIGDAFLGLKMFGAAKGEFQELSLDEQNLCSQAYWRPKPRLALIELLRQHATASVDISDGLIADLGHIAKASKVSFRIDLADIPLSSGAKVWVQQGIKKERTIQLITGGDDYEIAFTAHPKDRDVIAQFFSTHKVPLTRIGTCDLGFDVTCFDETGKVVPIAKPGYTHF